MKLKTIRTFDRTRKRKNTFCANCKTIVQSNVEISIPGLNRLQNPEYGKTIKLLWIAIIFFCSTICIYLTVGRLIEYFNYPTSTKTILQRNRKIKYPSFSICSYGIDKFIEAVGNDVESVCNTQYFTNNDSGYCNETSLQEMNISIDNIWNKINSFELTIQEQYLDNRQTPDGDFTSTTGRNFFGNCEVITHNTFTVYTGMNTQVDLGLNSPHKDLDFQIILHGRPVNLVNGWEFLYSQCESIKFNQATQFKIFEEKFQFKNKSGQECYSMINETQVLNQCVLDFLQSRGFCRLPFLPDSIEECYSLSDFLKTKNLIFSDIDDEISEACRLRKICDDFTHAISVDYQNRIEKSNFTNVTIKFANDITTIQYEYYSYRFPALVSDLFAYWGFFSCLNAFVFVEIFEFAFSKIYFMFKRKLR